MNEYKKQTELNYKTPITHMKPVFSQTESESGEYDFISENDLSEFGRTNRLAIPGLSKKTCFFTGRIASKHSESFISNDPSIN